jgi:hypothetical protein
MADVQPKHSSAFLLGAFPGQWTRYWPNTPKSTCNVYSTPQGLSAPPSSIAIYHCAGNKLLMLFCLADVEYGWCNESISSHERVCGVLHRLGSATAAKLALRAFDGVARRWFKVVWREGMALRGSVPFGGGVQPSVTGRQPDRGAAARTLS